MENTVMKLRCLLTLGLLSVLAAAPGHATSIHANDVFFAMPGLQGFTFTETSHSVTEGQPYKPGTSRVDKPGQGIIVVNAGRSKSEDVATWFMENVGSGQTVVCDSKKSLPEKLNFAVLGTLTLELKGQSPIVCEDVLIGQGHFGANNNWWVGGKNMSGAHVSFSGVATQKCKQKGGLLGFVEVAFTPQTPCVNHFSIGLVKP
jgi:hypothetical protein